MAGMMVLKYTKCECMASSIEEVLKDQVENMSPTVRVEYPVIVFSTRAVK